MADVFDVGIAANPRAYHYRPGRKPVKQDGLRAGFCTLDGGFIP